ncbi:MAG: prenyltransferase [Bacteroidales bacterium]|nr:prenyltransferase [Candidatus Cacconaster merdequi]
MKENKQITIKGHSVKDWLGATRFWSFPVSAMPVVATTAFLAWKCYEINWLCAALALTGNVVFHAAGNLLSDWWDYRKGVDNEEAYAVPNLVFHYFKPQEYMAFSRILFIVGIVIGLVLTILSGWQLLVIGIIGCALAASYSFFKFRALGDIFVFVCFGILPVIGSSFVEVGLIDWSALVLSLPLGIFTVAVLHDNNTVDITTDKASGIRTLPMFIGEKPSVVLYLAYIVVPYIVVAVFTVFGMLPPASLLCFLSIGVACGNFRQAYGYFEKGRDAMLGLDQKTAKLHLIFSVLLSVGLLVSAIF